MARALDLPRWFAVVHPRYQVPHRAEVALATTVIALVLLVDLRGAIGFSSFGVLLYYLIANLAAWTQSGVDRRYPRVLQAFGALACATLVITLPTTAVLVGAVVLGVGLVARLGSLRLVA